MEETRSTGIDQGFQTEAVNSRGGQVRDPTAGGEPERELASEYRGRAVAFRDRWPHVAEVFDSIADNFEAQGRERDIETDLRRLDEADLGG